MGSHIVLSDKGAYTKAVNVLCDVTYHSPILLQHIGKRGGLLHTAYLTIAEAEELIAGRAGGTQTGGCCFPSTSSIPPCPSSSAPRTRRRGGRGV